MLPNMLKQERDNKSFSSWLSASKTQVVTWWHFIYYAAPAPKMDPDLILLWHWEYTVSTAIGLIHDAQTGANWSQNVQKKHNICKFTGMNNMHKKCTFGTNVHTEHSKWTQGIQNVQLFAQNVSQYKPS